MEDKGQIILYQTEDGQSQLDVKLKNETVWLSVEQMAELFLRDRTVITRHINKIFKEGELDKSLVCAKIAQSKEYGRRVGKQYKKENPDSSPALSLGEELPGLRCKGTKNNDSMQIFIKLFLLKTVFFPKKLSNQHSKQQGRLCTQCTTALLVSLSKHFNL